MSFIKTYYKWIILILIGVGLFIYIKSLQNKIKKLNETATITKVIKSTSVPIIRYVDTAKEQHAVIDKNANTINESSLNKNVRIPLLDSVISHSNIKQSDIDQITKVNFSLSNNNILLQKKIDSLSKKPYYQYNGKFLHFTERDLDSTHRIGSYTYNGDIQWVDYSKKKIPIIGRTFSYTDIYSSDTSFRTNSVNRLTIQHNPTSWSFKLKAEILYNIGTGPKLEVGFKGITIGGARYYDIQGKSTNLISASYTLISF